MASPSFVPPPVPAVACAGGVIPAFQALLVALEGGTILYDVTDPVHPRAVCRIANTMAHIVTGTSFEYLVPNPDGTTSIVLHALGSNNEAVRATVQADLYHVSYGWYGGLTWRPGTDQLAYAAGGGTGPNGLGLTDVWLATPGGRTKIYSYEVPGKDAFGRPGFPPPTLEFSPDGAYLAAGWTVALTSVRVFRVADKVDVTPRLPADFRFAFWSRSAPTLYLVSGNGVSQWIPGQAVTPVPNTPAWILDPSLSPSGAQVAFTSVSSTREVRANVYDLGSQSNRTLSAQPRSSATFVRDGWVWEIEEKACVQSSNSACFDPTVPDGNVLAFELASGRESAVSFAVGESPSPYGFRPGDLWPA